jgi:hypothetical protein
MSAGFHHPPTRKLFLEIKLMHATGEKHFLIKLKVDELPLKLNCLNPSNNLPQKMQGRNTKT